MDFKKAAEEEQKARWYTIPDTNARVQIRRPKPSVKDRLEKECSKGRFNIVDAYKLGKKLLDYCVVDWENIESDGQSVEVTTENKYVLDGCSLL